MSTSAREVFAIVVLLLAAESRGEPCPRPKPRETLPLLEAAQQDDMLAAALERVSQACAAAPATHGCQQARERCVSLGNEVKARRHDEGPLLHDIGSGWQGQSYSPSSASLREEISEAFDCTADGAALSAAIDARKRKAARHRAVIAEYGRYLDWVRARQSECEQGRVASEQKEREQKRAAELASLQAAEAQRRAEEESRRRAAEEARKRSEEEARRKAEEAAARKAAEDARRKAEDDARRRAEEETRRKADEQRRREEAERARVAEQQRLEREKARRREEEERRRREEEERRKRLEQERREEAEQEAREKAERAAREKAEAEEEKRREEQEGREREAERKAREEEERNAKERKAAEEQRRQAEREAEDARREEERRAKREAEERILAERQAQRDALEAKKKELEEQVKERQRKSLEELEGRRKAEEERRAAIAQELVKREQAEREASRQRLAAWEKKMEEERAAMHLAEEERQRLAAQDRLEFERQEEERRRQFEDELDQLKQAEREQQAQVEREIRALEIEAKKEERTSGGAHLLASGGALSVPGAAPLGYSAGAVLLLRQGFWMEMPAEGLQSGFELAAQGQFLTGVGAAPGGTGFQMLRAVPAARLWVGRFGFGGFADYRHTGTSSSLAAGPSFSVAFLDDYSTRVVLHGRWAPILDGSMDHLAAELELGFGFFFATIEAATLAGGWSATTSLGARWRW